MCEHVFVSIKGSSYPHFRRALLTQNMAIIDAAARELSHMDLEDALRVLVAMARCDDERYPRAAARWAARAATERRLGMDDARRVLGLLEVLPEAPDAVEPVLRQIGV